MSDTRLTPNDVVAHFNRGNVLRENGDREGAIAAYCAALRLEPHGVEALIDRALALHDTGDLDGAIAAYRAVLRLNPNHVTAHLYLGFALYKKGDWDGAIAEYRTVLRLEPNHVSAHSNLGLALRAKGDVVLARKAFEEALRLIPHTSKNEAHIKTLQSYLSNLGSPPPRLGDPLGPATFICPACRSPALAIIASIELPRDSRSDEITAQVVQCGACRMIGAAAYEESRRGSLGSDDSSHHGYRLQTDRAVALLDLIRRCPTPTSGACTCKAHEQLGRGHDHRWVGLEPWGATDGFEMMRAPS